MARRRFLTKKRKRVIFLTSLPFVILSLVILVIWLVKGGGVRMVMEEGPPALAKVEQVDFLPNLLEPNPYSRSQEALGKVTGVVVHYTANPGTDAEANRNYFNNLAKTKKTYASSHFIIDLDGTIIQCIPLTEVAYASNQRNVDTIAIECCHPRRGGKFTPETYQSLVALTAWLCGEYGLSQEDVIRHYDVSGKDCPKYYVQHEDKWQEFRQDVAAYAGEHPVIQ